MYLTEHISIVRPNSEKEKPGWNPLFRPFENNNVRFRAAILNFLNIIYKNPRIHKHKSINSGD